MKIAIENIESETIFVNVECGDCFKTPGCETIYMKLGEFIVKTSVNAVDLTWGHVKNFNDFDVVTTIKCKLVRD